MYKKSACVKCTVPKSDQFVSNKEMFYDGLRFSPSESYGEI